MLGNITVLTPPPSKKTLSMFLLLCLNTRRKKWNRSSWMTWWMCFLLSHHPVCPHYPEKSCSFPSVSLDNFTINIEVSKIFDDSWEVAMYHCDLKNYGPPMTQKHDVDLVGSGKLFWKTPSLKIENLKFNSKTSKNSCFQFFHFWNHECCQQSEGLRFSFLFWGFWPVFNFWLDISMQSSLIVLFSPIVNILTVAKISNQP